MSNLAEPRRRTLIVDDEKPIRELLRAHLSRIAFDIDDTGDGRDALERVRRERYDLITIDIVLPNLDGITLCRSIRADGANRTTPILMLSARDSESDTILGLESGADDYLTKPFDVRELVARVTALIRRSAPDDRRPGTIVAARGLILDSDRRTVSVQGRPVALTSQEFDVLYLLASRPGIVFSREALVSRVWHGDPLVTERTVDTLVSRLRRKIERDAQDPALILTAWGLGYKFADTEL